MRHIYANTNKEETESEKKNRLFVKKSAAEGIVLLKNDGTLPLKRNCRRIALFGKGARKTIKGGTGSGDVNTRSIISLEQGFQRAGIEVTTGKWLDEYDRIYQEAYLAYKKKIRQRIENGEPLFKAAFENPFFEPEPQQITPSDAEESKTDLAVFVISRVSGEGSDRKYIEGDYLLSKTERENICFLAKTYPKLVVLLNVGGPVEITEWKEMQEVNAIMNIGQCGDQIGDIVADVLFGRTYPSGKLTSTWAKSFYDYPSAQSYIQADRPDDSYYNEGIYVGYRYFDTYSIEPAYCFGYGMGYTLFSIKAACDHDENGISVSAEVKNIGNDRGKEVVQVYAALPAGALDQPAQRLIGFCKTKELSPGETETVKIRVELPLLSSYSAEEEAWILEKGKYGIYVGNSSRDTERIADFIMEEGMMVEKVCNRFPAEEKFEELHGKETVAEEAARNGFSAVQSWQRKKEDIQEESKEFLYELVGNMTEEELVNTCVGTGWMSSEKGKSVIGEAAITVPGAAGETFYNQRLDIPNVVMADGPAGIRLEEEFEMEEDGTVIHLKEMFADLLEDAGKLKREESKEGKAGSTRRRYYQYCTAIPIAAMLAQTWNLPLLEQYGRLIGSEMKTFGVSLWLAPGMNIQRNPLCGRNFEYFSEDPLVSGKCASAITRGVQNTGNLGVTIKHFAVNNQENNRSHNNSHVQERSLREIYLKGFEICIKESQPVAVMTSYNLLNGIHTANHKALLTDVLRGEWGYRGMVMTDWGTTGWGPEEGFKYPCSSAVECMMAGNDLIMPGSLKDRQELLDRLKNKEDIDFHSAVAACAYRVLSMVFRLVQK